MPDNVLAIDGAVLPAYPAILLLIALAFSGGGYSPDVWYPTALIFLALLGTALVYTRGPSFTGTAKIAIAALTAYVCWSYLSVFWAGSPGLALEGSNRALMYLACFALFAILPWRPSSAAVVLGAIVLGLALVGLTTVVRLAVHDTGVAVFRTPALSWPIQYHPANAALFGLGTPLALMASVRPECPPPLRGIFLAAAALFVHLAILSQSRGWLFALAVAVGLACTVAEQRRRLLAAIAIVGATTVLVLPQLLHVYTASGLADRRARFGTVARTSLLVVLAVGLAGWVVSTMDLRAASVRVMRRIQIRKWAIAALGFVALVAVLFGVRRGLEASHFVDLSTGRGDIWRVGMKLAAGHPIVGIGQDNFNTDYLRLRTGVYQDLRWVHSLALRLVVHTGLVGLGLFAAFVVAAFAAVHPLGRRGDPASTVPKFVLLPAVMWLVQGSFDWLWEVPSLTCIAMAALGMAVGLASTRQAPDRPAAAAPLPPAPASRVELARARMPQLLAATVVVAAIAVVVPQYRAARDLGTGMRTWRTDPDRAYRALRQSAREDRRTARADIAAGLVALNLDQTGTARHHFSLAMAREPANWFPLFAAGLLDGAAGNLDLARSELRRAGDLNPLEAQVRSALDRLGSDDPLTFKPLTFRGARGDLQPLMLESSRIGASLDYAASPALALVGYCSSPPGPCG